MRRRALLLTVALVTLVAVSVQPAAGGQPPLLVSRAIYVVRPDPRLCPSPLCGGYWVALANRARTRCADGLFRPRCYVARVLSPGRGPVTVAANGLVRGGLDLSDDPEFGKLGELVVSASWRPASETPPSGRYYRIRDTGRRCVRAPCFSLRARRVNGGGGIMLSGFDFGAIDVAARPRAEAALGTRDGLHAAGRVTPTPDGGRTFEASQAFLKVSELPA